MAPVPSPRVGVLPSTHPLWSKPSVLTLHATSSRDCGGWRLATWIGTQIIDPPGLRMPAERRREEITAVIFPGHGTVTVGRLPVMAVVQALPLRPDRPEAADAAMASDAMIIRC